MGERMCVRLLKCLCRTAGGTVRNLGLPSRETNVQAQGLHPPVIHPLFSPIQRIDKIDRSLSRREVLRPPYAYAGITAGP